MNIVSSKSGRRFAEMLTTHHIPFRDEALIHVETYSFSPDFTIPVTAPAGDDLFYWEHCGMMENETCRKRNKWKLSMYEKAGIVPWKNLIITYDDEESGINTSIINSEILNKLLPRNIAGQQHYPYEL